LRGQLRTADTRIEVEAGEHAPRLVGVGMWSNRAEEALPVEAEVAGAAHALTWRLDRGATHFDARVVRMVYRTDAPRLELVSEWRARAGHGPLEHTISIRNASAAAITLGLVPSLRFDWRIAPSARLERFWVEKGADTPSAEGTHLDAFEEGAAWEGHSSTYARPVAGRPREMIPYVLVEAPGEHAQGWYLGIEFSGRTHIALARAGSSLRGEAGLDPEPAPYRTRLPPDATFTAPTVLLGAFTGDADDAGNLLRRWIRGVLGNPRARQDPSYPWMVDNSWGSGIAVDDALARRMIRQAAELGLEMFHLDAGWFRDVGDWHPDPVKFPRGIAAIADFARAQGLKFGLWVDWAQAGASRAPGALDIHDPATRDWLIADPPAGWKHTEPFKGITIDLGVPAAAAWAARELERIVTDYHLDMLEHDGYLVAQGSTRTDTPATPPDPASLRVHEDSGYLWVDSSNATDVSYHATRAYYDVYRGLRERHPNLLLEICNDGGRMVDFGSAAHGDYFSITDTYDPLSNRRAFHDASFVLPPAMLESYVEKWPAPRIENFRYLLRSGMLGWFSLMQDASTWSPAQRAEARRQFALYKSALRPLIRDADLYHVSARPDGVHWDGIEYYSQSLRRGVLYAFRGSGADERTHRFRLRGLEPSRRYRVAFHDRGGTSVMTGRELTDPGVAVALPLPLSSELIFLEEAP
jgi:hypothetical protein